MNSTIRILVTGSREGVDRKAVWAELDDVYETWVSQADEFIVVHGGARGVDRFAGDWCKRHENDGVTQEIHEPHWEQGGAYVPSAGHQRNQKMVNLGADLVLAFVHNNSAGATGCMRAAMKAGLEVRVLRTNDQEEA